MALENSSFAIFPCKCLCDPIWPWLKIGQVQPRVIIWINLVGPESPMLHIRFQGCWPVSIKNIFKGLLTYMSMVWSCHPDPMPKLSSLIPYRLSKWHGLLVLIKVHLAACINQLWCHTLRLQRNQKPSFKVIGHLVHVNKIFRGFYHIWLWWPSWLCDPDFRNKLLFPYRVSTCN